MRGRPDPETGYVLDLGDLKRILERRSSGRATTATSTRTSISCKGIIPTTENLVVAFWRRIAPGSGRASSTAFAFTRRRATSPNTGDREDAMSKKKPMYLHPVGERHCSR